MATRRSGIICFAVLGWSTCSAFTSPSTTGLASARLSIVRTSANNNDDMFHDDFASNDDFLQASSAERNQEETSPSPSKDLSSQPAFPSGPELQQLRADLQSYRENLKWAAILNDTERVISLQMQIEEQERRDPEIVYNKAQYLVNSAKASTNTILRQDLKDDLIDFWEQQAKMARSFLPRFQLEGLWVGNYGNQGPQLVNVSYVDDTLVAVRVTGDTTVPRGEVSFTVDLRQRPKNKTDDGTTTTDATALTPSPLTSSKEDESFYPGEGQISKQHFVDNKFVPGLFVVYDSTRFSFSWIPSKHHVLFTRPSPLETLRLLRDVLAKEDEVQNMRDHLNRCFEMDMTTSIARQQIEDQHEPFRRIKLQKEIEQLKEESAKIAQGRGSSDGKEGDEESGRLLSFWRARKWKKYIDNVLGQGDGPFQ